MLKTNHRPGMWIEGTFVPTVSGGSDDDPGKGEEGEEGEEGENPPPKTFSQKDTDRIAGKARKEGKEVARKELFDELGVDEETLKGIVSKHRESEDKEKSDTEKEREQARRERDAADRAKREAAEEKTTARIEGALTRAGCPDEKIERVSRMIDREDLGDDPSRDDVRAAVEELKEEFPHLFKSNDEEEEEEGSGGEETSGNRGMPNSDPGKPKVKPKGGKSAKERADDVFASRHPNLVKQS